MKTLNLDNAIVNDDTLYQYDCVVELEDDETIEQVQTQFNMQGLKPVYVRFVEYTSNLNEEQLENCVVYSQNIGGMAYELESYSFVYDHMKDLIENNDEDENQRFFENFSAAEYIKVNRLQSVTERTIRIVFARIYQESKESREEGK